MGDRGPDRPYRGLARIYDRVMGDAVFPLTVRNFERAVRTYAVQFNSAADIGCGTGRFLRHLARYGIPVWGVDRSPAMLSLAAERTRGTGAVLLRQDITRLRLPVPVDLITCNFDTLNYLLSPDALRRAIGRCRANLSDGGHLIFDCIAGSGDAPGWRRERQEIRLPGVTSVWSIAWNPARRTSIVRMRHRFEGKQGASVAMREEHRQRWYPADTLMRILRDAGFAVRGIHDAECFSHATNQTFWTRYVCRKVRPDHDPRSG